MAVKNSNVRILEVLKVAFICISNFDIIKIIVNDKSYISELRNLLDQDERL